MPQSCDPNWDFSTRVISDTFILLCSFIFSQPLYFSYLIFFSPYLLKLFSFLSPLFLTTSLLILAFLTAFLRDDNNFYHKFKDAHNQDILSFDDLGIYETLFGSSVMEDNEFSSEEKKEEQMEKLDNLSEFPDGKPEGVVKLEKSDDVVVNNKVEEVNSSSGKKSQMEGKRMENFQKILDGFEKMASNAEGKKTPRGPKFIEKQKSEPLSIGNGSGAINCNKPNGAKAREEREEEENGGERKLRAESSRALMAVNGYGSMRREKEWKRTLACKLFEERHNVDGGEGMDSLWEAYEIDSNKTTKHRNETKTKNTKTNKKIDFGFIDKCEEEEEEDEVAAPLCCLQALKLSTGKMNLGVGIPNLVKISKAIKGIGWLHSVSKHSKKVHNNNGDRY